MQNSSLSVTKESYFQMCEMLGSEPIDSEIPVELDDLPIEVQESITVYRLLKDEWDFVNGNYLGKSLLGLQDIFNICKIADGDRMFTLEIINLLDSIRSEHYASKKTSKK